MLRFGALVDKHFLRAMVLRYGIALASVAAAFTTVSILQHYQIRDPLASIFLAAIAVSVWYGGAGPGLLGIALSTLVLHAFVRSSNGWLHIGLRDLPYFGVFILFGLLIYRFTRTRRHAEQLLQQGRNHLEEEVETRTIELTRLNLEYKTILDAAPFGIALFELGRVVRRSNPAYEKMLGWKPGESVGHVAPLPESEKETWRIQEQQLRQGKGFVNYEAPRLRLDGSQFSATISATPLFDKDGTYAGLVGLIMDNTERHAQEVEHQMLTALVQHSPDFVGVADMSGTAVFVNRAGQKLFGLDGDDHVRRTNVLEYFAEAERAAAQDQLIPTLVGERHLEFETTGRNFQTGESFPLHCTGFVIPDTKTGDPAFIAAVAQDITERKRAEENLQMFRSIVQNSPDFIGAADMNLIPVFVNTAGQQIFGLDGDEHVKRTHTLEYFAEEERARVNDELIPLLLRQGHLTVEVPAKHFKTGKSFPALWTSFVIYDTKMGTPSLLAAFTRDITDRKRAEEELRRRDDYLTEGQKISHTGSWAWNATTSEGFWSQELFRILGLDPETVQPSPSAYFGRVHPEDQPELDRLWREAVEAKTGLDHKHRIVRPDGSIRHVRRLGRAFSTGSKEVEFIGTVVDVTEQHEDRAALQKSLDANRALLEENRLLQEQLREENISLKEQNLFLKQEFNHGEMFKEIIGSSVAIERTLARVEKVASTDSTVLITGETGTGKELIAHAIHMASLRADKSFISFNCAAFVPSLIASELFGHEKGAFTGAEARRVGRFELAEGGTIFLDEVGDIPAETQIILLRVLQEREFERIGGNRPIRVDVRVLAATNRDLQAAIEKGTFRSDLFYRLNVFPIEVPPLRERREDIPMLVWHFVQQYARKLGKKIPKIEQRSMELLESYPWPGNIRQLQNVIETSMVVGEGDTLAVDEKLLSRSVSDTKPADQPFLHMPLAESRLDHERKRIDDALARCNGQVDGPTGAAALLGMRPSTLRSRMKALRINPHLFKTDQRSIGGSS
jgi:PAS domain S-box-containing protein